MSNLPTAGHRAGQSLAGLGGPSAAALDLLQGLLPLAVADTIARVRPETWDQRLARLDRIRAEWAAEGRDGFGEAIPYRVEDGRRKGVPASGTGTEFVRPATALAAMSFCPGGVRAFGLHWESR